MLDERWPAITLRQLQIFAVVGEHRSFAKAAERLSLTQPGVSSQVKELERALRVKLLVRARGRRQIELTEPGKLLFSTCEEIRQTLRRSEHELDGYRGLERGSVAVGSSVYFGTYILPHIQVAFEARFPAIGVTHGIGRAPKVVDWVGRHRFDLGVVVGPVEEPGLIVKPFGSYDVILVGRPGHRLARGALAPFAELANERMLLPGSFRLRSSIQKLAVASGISLQIAMESNNIEAKIEGAASGVGIAPIGVHAAAREIAAGRLVQLEVEGFPVRLNWVIIHRKDDLSVAAREYLRHLMAYRSSLASPSLDHSLAHLAPVEPNP
jgi:DNA-binding transcriptional LysR family regulator